MQLQINLPFSMHDYKLSGVYKITFEDGSFYIGCSCHLRSRASTWNSIMRTGKGVAGEDIGTKVIVKIRELSTASFDIIELCRPKDLKDKESFYLDKYKDDPQMLSSDSNGAWKAVLQYKNDGLFIKKHYSIMGAARYMKSNMSAIQKVLYGERKQHKGMVFIFEHDYHQRRKEIVKSRNITYERKKGRNVLMVDTNGVAIKEYRKIVDAAREVGIRPENIRKVLNGHQKSTKGYIFKYA